MYSFRAAEESDEDRAIREANRAYCVNQVEEIRQIWRNSYEEHIGVTAEKVRYSPGAAKIVAQRQLDFLRTLANSPPQCDITDTNTLETAEAARMALKPPFSSLPKEQRRAIWADSGHEGNETTPARRPKITKSHLASVLQHASKIVDLRYVVC
jgi:hypothetical protein